VQCSPHAATGTLFGDATENWGLGKTGLNVTGNRIVAADLDGDGYPDLIISSSATNRREQIGVAPKLQWVLMNRPRPGGGRRFVDATVESGLFQVRGGSTTELRAAHLAAVGDVDNDGDLDVFSGTFVDPNNGTPAKPMPDTGDRSEVMLNDGTGHFTLAPPSASRPTAAEKPTTTSATFVDADRDGRLDLFVGFWYERYGYTYNGLQAQLYHGFGDGSFLTVTDEVGLKTQPDGFAQGLNHRPAYGVTSCDLDGDGAPELMVSAYGRQWNLLYQNDGNGNFTEVGQKSGYAGDSNRDYSDNDFFACYCTVHPSQPDCAGVAAPRSGCPTPADSYWSAGSDDQPWRLNGNTFSTYCGDLDGDGKPDLYSAEIAHWHIGQSSDHSEMLRSKTTPGNILFERPGRAATGLVWPHVNDSWNEGGLMVAGGDLDSDGREDLVVAASDYPDNFGLVYHQKEDRTFEEVGAPWDLHHACVSGLAIADFDRDGDLDVVVGSGTARDCSLIWKTNEVHLYENAQPARGWLEVKLAGDGLTANRTGIGAKVTVTVMGESQVKELQGGYGHMTLQNDTVLHFGLGDCPAVDRVTVAWPDRAGTVQVFEHVEVNRLVELRMGDPEVHTVPLGP
jgi:hypothetical protein